MPRIFVPPEKLYSQQRSGFSEEMSPSGEGEEVKGAIRLTGEYHNYLTRVLRLTINDEVTVFDGEKLCIPAVITAIDAKTVTLSPGDPEGTDAVRGPRTVLLQGLLKSDKMDLVIRQSVELGVGVIVPVLCKRSVPHPAGERAERRLKRWQRIVEAACGQCGRVDLPEIMDVQPDIENALALNSVIQAGDCCEGNAGTGSGKDAVNQPPDDCWSVVLWEECKSVSLVGMIPSGLEAKRVVSLLIGPEGGLTETETQLCRGAGFRVASLGRLILRSETAAMAALTLVSSSAGLLG